MILNLTNGAKFYFKLERTIIKSIMFEHAHFLACYLPQCFNDKLVQINNEDHLNSMIQFVKNFLEMALKLYDGFTNSIHLNSFVNHHFSLQLAPLNTSSSPNYGCLLHNVLLHAREESKDSVIGLSVRIVGLLFYTLSACSQVEGSRDERMQSEIVGKFLSLCQKLRFQVQISHISTGECRNNFDQIIERIFSLPHGLNVDSQTSHIIRQLLSAETHNISQQSKRVILKNIRSPSKIKREVEVMPAINKVYEKSERYQVMSEDTVRKELNQKSLVSQRQAQNAKTRLKEYARMKKIKQIFKSAPGKGKDNRVIYQMRTSKFVPKEGMSRSVSNQIFEYSTQFSSRSLEEFQRVSSQRSRGYEQEIDIEENESDILVGSTPRVERRLDYRFMVSRKLGFEDE